MSLDDTFETIYNLLSLATAAALSEAKPLLVPQPDSLHGALTETLRDNGRTPAASEMSPVMACDLLCRNF